MTKLDTIVAVKDVVKSSDWYQAVFGFKSMHAGNEFNILVNNKNDVMLCLHKWGEHNHPTMQTSNMATGNGLILYFRTENMDHIRKNLRKMNYGVEEEINLSPNSRRKEFSFKDPDGYYITVAEFHKYEG